MVQTIRTRVFALRDEIGITSDSALAQVMGLSQETVSAVRRGYRNPGSRFIRGALCAFPDKTFDDLFYVEEVAEADGERDEVAS